MMAFYADLRRAPDGDSSDLDSDVSDNVPRTRNVRPRPIYTQSPWWHMYINNTDCRIAGTNEYKTFRRRFGVTFDLFREFVNTARSWGIFSEKPDAVGRQPVPLELKVLGALRMVAKGCAFDAIAELSSMGLSTMQQFFHKFWDKFVSLFSLLPTRHKKWPQETDLGSPNASFFWPALAHD